MIFLLDSSAWLAHLFAESGSEQITLLFDDDENEIAISVLSLPELYSRLKSMEAEAHWPNVWSTYRLLFSKVFMADEAIAHQAIALRAAAEQRLPTIDALIAATAAYHGLTLVHRDPHFATIPSHLLLQQQLPDK